MGAKQDKLIERLLNNPKDFTWEEAERLFIRLGYVKDTKGKTSGSRVSFYKESTQAVFLLHIPHPQKELKPYAVKSIIDHLKERGEI